MPDELLQAVRQYINSEYLMDDYEVTADKLHKYCAQLLVHVADVTAERDAAKRQRDTYYEQLQGAKAQLDAVPLNAIALYWEATIVEYGRLAHEDHMKVAKADEAVENWVVEVKYGKKEVTK